MDIQVDVTFLLGDEIMVNATEMAKPFGKSKKPAYWLKSQKPKEIIALISEVTKITSADLVKVIKGGDDKIFQGTYMHRKVALNYSFK